MARKPNYDFERREREKAKATKAADRAKAKADRRERPGEADGQEDASLVEKDDR